MGDWCCLPRSSLGRWCHERSPGLLRAENDYDHLVVASFSGAPVSLHCHEGVSVLRLSGIQATLFRSGESGLLLNRHMDAINHDEADIGRLTGTCPVVADRVLTLFTASIDNTCPEWVVFDGRFPGEAVLEGRHPCLILRVPVGFLWLGVFAMSMIDPDPRREVLAISFGDPGR